jgi:hypothetical protein
MKLAFVRSEVQSNLCKLFENSGDMYLMCSHGIAVDQDVVEISCSKVVEERPEYGVDQVLERGGIVGESKGHNKGFKKTITGAKDRVLFLTFSQTDQVVGVSNVKGSVVTGFGQAVQGFSYQREGVSILDCAIVEASIIDTES